jgi:quercetin dioxygenase-like cupin family protein
MNRGYVGAEDAVAGVRADGDTALIKVTIGATQGCEQLEQRVIRFAPGRSLPRRLDDRDDVMFVVSGAGSLEVGGVVNELEPNDGVFVIAGETAVVSNGGPDDLVVISVLTQASGGHPDSRVVKLSERPRDRADAKRTFRVLRDKSTGAPGITQFVGYVEPYRAPDHSHPYDEVGYVLAGRGLAHLNGTATPLGPGSCFHLPPDTVHCIENVGPEEMRILGVFHPSDSPAARSYDAAYPATSSAT